MERHLSSAECMLVRETMVRQEKVYREQVQALHYLYQVQKTLMDEHVAKSCWDVSNRPPDGFQFFPTREEERRRRPVMSFDLEKLPDECLEPEPEPEPRFEANVDLALHSPFVENPKAGFQASWLPENSWKPSSQLGSSWLQLRSDCQGAPALAAPAPAPAPPWYSTSSAHHPWQASGASYFSLEPSPLQGAYFSKGNSLGSLLQSGGFSGNVLGFGAPKVPGFCLQQEEIKYPRNGQVLSHHGYGNVLLDYLVSRETQPGSSSWRSNAGVFGDRNFYRETLSSTIQKTCGELQNSFNIGAKQAPVAQKEPGIETAAASVLLSLGLDTSYSPREKEASDGSLKKSVEWFADAIPDEPVASPEKGPEVDQFEAEMLLVKESLFEEHAPLSLEVEQTVASPPRSNKGRPSRVCKRRRDFRSGTLASITSLSRQEINEDIQMMSGLLRAGEQLKSERRGGGSKVCRMKNSTSPVSTLDMNKVPWLVSWGVATRRKRKKRQRASLKAAKGSASGGLSLFSSVLNIKMQ